MHDKRNTGRWLLWRQDDHGNRFEVAVFDTKAEAERERERYERRGHKQMYWVMERRELAQPGR